MPSRALLAAACASIAALSDFAEALACPTAREAAPPERTLTMDCLGACADPFQPCLFYWDAGECEAQRDESSSECVAAEDGGCAVECFWPFSGADNSSWNLMVTNKFEYKIDLRDWHARDPNFRIAKKNVSQLAAVADIVFPPNTTLISISGNAMPIDIKAINYIVLNPGEGVNFEVPGDVLANATDCRDMRVENINMSQLTTFPDLPNLQRLILSNSMLQGVPAGLSNMSNLTSVDLSQNSFKSIGLNTLPPNTKDLCLLACELATVPAEILALPHLKKLDLSGNKFAIPSAGSLPLQLETFIYYDMYQSSLPPDIIDMTSLKRLDIGWNAFSSPSQIETLPISLTHLGLSGNFLPDLPSSISKLINLASMDISVNSFRANSPTTLPPNLKMLNASSNSIESLPDNILPTSLEYLNLSYNNFGDMLPVGFENLQKLTDLYLDGNAFTTIPSAIFSLSSLQRLSLSSSFGPPQITLSSEQVEYLNTLENFVISGDDPDSFFSTSCDSPVQVHNYSACISSAVDMGAGSASGGRNYAWLYITAPVVVAVILIASIIVLRRRRQRVPDPSISILSNSKDRRPMFSIDSHLDHDAAMGDTQGTSTAFFSVAKTPQYDNESMTSTGGASSGAGSMLPTSRLTTMGSSMSIWEDEELLKARIDVQQVREIELISSGYFGEVWLATYMDEYVALKRLKRRNAERRDILRFMTEIKAHGRFDHPKIVTFIGVAWTMESDVQAVMEYMEGGDLRSYLSALVSEETEAQSHWDDHALSVAMDIVEALVYLHSLDPAVLHRDLKSRNVLLDGQYHAKVTDFGVSTECREWSHETDESASTSASVMTSGVGTARWAAPEVLAGSDRYGSGVDMYSFGVILSELDTRRMPFAERAGEPENYLLSQIAAGELRPRFSRSAPVALVALAQRCLSFDPAKRPSAVEAAYLLRMMRLGA